MKIIAHRGASHDAPENTLAAFRLAFEQGADGVEGDFYLTADGQIVCIHDADTKRTSGKKLIVEQSTLAQLRELEFGRWKDTRFDGETIPTLDEVIECVPDGKTLVIELKSTLRIVPQLIERLKKHRSKPIDWLVIAFDGPTIAEFKRQMPDVKAHWLTGFERNLASSYYHPTASQIADRVKLSLADGVGMKGEVDLIDERFVEQLREGGCREFHVWTIDSIDDAKYFVGLGAIGITTNVPAKIGPAVR